MTHTPPWQFDVPIPTELSNGQSAFSQDVQTLFEMPIGASIFMIATPQRAASIQKCANNRKRAIGHLIRRKLRENGVNGYRFWKIAAKEKRPGLSRA